MAPPSASNGIDAGPHRRERTTTDKTAAAGPGWDEPADAVSIHGDDIDEAEGQHDLSKE